jgi:hypothetical protein
MSAMGELDPEVRNTSIGVFCLSEDMLWIFEVHGTA